MTFLDTFYSNLIPQHSQTGEDLPSMWKFGTMSVSIDIIWQFDGSVVSTGASQQEAPVFGPGVFLQNLHVLLMLV